MNTRKVNIIALMTALLVLSACGSTASQRLASGAERPILSAAQAKSMIRVEVRTLAPIPEGEALVALAN